MIPCPSCKRRVFTARHMLHASLDGAVKCTACGKLARLDMISRWMLACMVAIILPMVLLYANVFYSGHLFVVSLVVMLCVWRGLSMIGLPILGLELVPRGICMDRRQGIVTLGVIVVAALVMDGFMAHRIDADEARANEKAPSASVRPQ